MPPLATPSAISPRCSSPRGAVAATRALIRGDQAALEAALEAEAVAFEERLRAPEAQAAFARFLGRAKPA